MVDTKQEIEKRVEKIEGECVDFSFFKVLHLILNKRKLL